MANAEINGTQRDCGRKRPGSKGVAWWPGRDLMLHQTIVDPPFKKLKFFDGGDMAVYTRICTEVRTEGMPNDRICSGVAWVGITRDLGLHRYMRPRVRFSWWLVD